MPCHSQNPENGYIAKTKLMIVLTKVIHTSVIIRDFWTVTIYVSPPTVAYSDVTSLFKLYSAQIS